jgi:hypothetical protein
MRSAFILVSGATLLLSAVSPAIAEDSPVKPNSWSIGASAGTLGVGGEVSYLARDYVGLRAAASFFNLDCGSVGMVYGGAANCADYNFKVTGLFAGGMVDVYPFKGGWRLSAGVRYTDVEATAKATAKDDITFNDHSYSVDQVGAVKISIKNSNQAAPYIGFGYDSSHYSEGWLKLGFEVGALYLGAPNVSITTEKTNIPGLSADIAKETSKLKDDYGKYLDFYPVAMFSARVAF